MDGIRALTFDVFGTVVDWRGSIIREGEAFNREKGLAVDWAAVADEWRGLYQPMMEKVRSGALPWTNLDGLHRMALDELAPRHGLEGLSATDLDRVNRMWHRLDPWPDVIAGLARLKKRYVLATLSNGNVSLMVDMAKRAGLPWDAILGAEVARVYKPQPEAYLATARYLDLAPGECMMVAAHASDLAAAAACGFRTAHVFRPLEYGPGRQRTAPDPGQFDVLARDLNDLADQLGC